MGEYLADMWRLVITGDRQGIFFFASLYTFVMLGYSVIYQLRVAAWPKTKGMLHKAAVEKWGGTHVVRSDQDYIARSLYEYSVQGVVYQGTRVSPWVMIVSHNARFFLRRQMDEIERDEDGSVSVFYNPQNPAKSFLIKPGRVGIIATAILAVVPAWLYWLGYHT